MNEYSSGFLKKPWIFPILIGVVIVITGMLYVGLPASPDQLELDYLAWLVLDGGIPYLYFVDNNWPGGYWLHMISTQLFGNTFHSWRIFDYLLMCISLGFLADLLRRTFGSSSAMWALILFPGLYTTAVGFWFPGQRDAVVANLFWIALWSHWNAWSQCRISWQLLTGFIIALAVLLKPTAIVIAPLLVLHGAWWAWRCDRWALALFLRQECVAVAAGLVTLVSVFSAILFQGTPLDALLDSVWRFNLYSQGDASITVGILVHNALLIHLDSWHWISLVAFVSAFWLFVLDRRYDPEAKLLIAFVWVAGWASYFIQGRAFNYHLAIVYSGMLPFLFIGLGKLGEYLRSSSFSIRHIIAGLGIAIVLLGTVKKYHTQYTDTFRWLTGELSDREYYDGFAAGDAMSLGEVYELLPKLDEGIAPGETLLMIGTQSAANYVLGRRQPIRHYYFPIFLEAHAPVEMVERWNMIFRDEIKRDHSPMALVDRSAIAAAPRSGNRMTIESLKFLKSELAEHYEKIRGFDKVDLYRRRR